ncbi:MAG: hypothetical protein AAGJ84_05520 [Pseudomonadota bacterium]
MTKDVKPQNACSCAVNSKGAPPFGWVSPKELLVVFLTGHCDFGSGVNLQEELRSLGQSIEFTSCALDSPNAPPWLNSSFVEAFYASLKKQAVIYSETLCSAQLALAMMSLQRGQETFIVLGNTTALNAESILRIQRAGAPALSKEAFVTECIMAEAKR